MENPFKNRSENQNKESVLEEKMIQNESDSVVDETNQKETDIENVVTENENIENKEDKKNEWQEKYEKLNDQYIRLAADFDNYRKRQVQETENLLKYGAEKTVKPLLEVVDNFDRGLQAIENVEDCEKLKECYKLAYKNFNDVLVKIGLETIKAIGEEFDPNLHEAVMQTPTDEQPENVIMAELQKGYTLGGKVIRPSLVNVATTK